MAKPYNVFNTRAELESYRDAVHAHPIFDNGGIIGNINGVPSPNNARTVNYYTEKHLRELLDGRWGCPRIPAEELEFHEIPQADIDAVKAAHPYVEIDLEESDLVPFPENYPI